MTSIVLSEDGFPDDAWNDESLLNEFESIWMSGTVPDIQAFIASHGDSARNRSELLSELVRLDLEYRFRSANIPPKSLTSYLDEHPTLMLNADLIEDEWRLRKRFGEPLTEHQWRNAFPESRFLTTEAHAEFLERLNEWIGEEDPLMTMVRASESPEAHHSPMDSWAGLSVRFRREELLGEGSFGVVWKAFDHQLQRSVAIKTLHPELAQNHLHRDAMIDEARSAAALDHPDLMTIYDVIGEGGQVHLVMRLVDGQPLDVWWREIAQNPQPCDLREMASVMARISRAVHHAHLSGLIHCDLKPQNVLVDARGNPTILDFGLAIRRCHQEHLQGRVFGTPSYMSPEQSFGETHHLDGRSDVWSLGVMLYKLMTNQLPFTGATTSQVLEAIQVRSVTPPGQLRDDVPPDLARICLRCLSKRIEDRYETAAELAGDLQQFADAGLSSKLLLKPTARGGRLIGCPWSEPDLVGRDDVIRSAVSWLSDPNHRLVTLTGMGGLGKTQTAAAIARQLAPQVQVDIFWVDAATTMDPDQFAAAVLSSLGVAQTSEESSRRRVAQILAVRGPVILVLDNVEQIVRTAGEQISVWLSQNPDLKLIVTSQLPLRIHGERVLQLEPLSVDSSELAVELFTRRAADVRPDFKLSAANKPDIVEICRLVDGNPLAIELAAARVGVLTIANLLTRLSQSFAVLKTNRMDRPDRHRTLSDVVSWSVNLLGPNQRKTLKTLALWPAPVSLQIAESLVASLRENGDESGDAEDDPLDWIDELRERQLLRLREDDETMHLHADNTIGRFVFENTAPSERARIASAMLDQLILAPPPDSSVNARHVSTNLWTAASWLITNAGSDTDAGSSTEDRQKCGRAILAADRLAADQIDSNLRIERIEFGMALCSQNDRIEMMVRLADAKRLAGQTEQAERICRELLDGFEHNDDTDTASATRSLSWEVETRRLLAQLLFRHSRSTEAVDLLQSSLNPQRRLKLHDATRIAVLLDLIEFHRRLGHLSLAMELLAQGQALTAGAEVIASKSTDSLDEGVERLIPGLTIQEGKIALQRGRIAEARNLFDQALGQHTRLGKNGNPRQLQQALLGRAAAAAESGDFQSAEQDYDRCQRISQQLGDLPTLAQSLNNRALAADDAGDNQKCCEILTRALEIYKQLDDHVGISICLAARAASLLQLGRLDESLAILTSAEVTEHLPPGSIHQAIVWGDMGTCYHRLGKLDEAIPLLQNCIDQLDTLGVGNTAERLLYEIERYSLRCDSAGVDSVDAAYRESIARAIEYWERQPGRRARVNEAIICFQRQSEHGD